MSTVTSNPPEGREGTPRPPRDNLVRAIWPGVELRAAEEGSPMPTLTGHAAVFNQWTEIHSMWEGDFLEQIAPGAFRKTIREQRNDMRVLFQHGRDPQIGDKPLGPIGDLREDDVGLYYESPMLDTTYNRDLIPGLEAGLYGASFRFGVMKEVFDENPSVSAHNPKGMPERTIKEARVMEFGPVTFPAYAGASAELASVGVRSLTDEFIFEQFIRDPERLRALVDFIPKQDEPREEDSALQQDDAGDSATPSTGAATPKARTGSWVYGLPKKETPPWRL